MHAILNSYPRLRQWIKDHDALIIRVHLVTLIISIITSLFTTAYYTDYMFDCATQWDYNLIGHIIVFAILLHIWIFIYAIFIVIFGTKPTRKDLPIIIGIPMISIIGLIIKYWGNWLEPFNQIFSKADFNIFLLCNIPLFLFGLCVCRTKLKSWIIHKTYLEYPWFYKIFGCLIIAFISFFLCEFPLNDHITIPPIFLAINLAYYIIIYLFFFLMFQRAKPAAIITPTIAWIIGIANYELLFWRNDYILLSDLQALQTAINVAQGYAPKIGWPIIITTILLILVIVAVCILPKAKYTWTNAKPLKFVTAYLGCILMIIVIAISYRADILSAKTEGLEWDVTNAVDRHGYLMYFIANAHYSIPEQPDEYNPEELNTVLSQYITPTEQENTKHPTIILIQNEAWNDFRLFADIQTNQPIMPVLDAMTQNTQKGFLATSVDHGPTAYTELEVITSLTLRYFSGTNPFLQMIDHATPSAATVLHTQDTPYINIFYHPYHASGYDRQFVYNYLDFDETIFYEKWDDKECNGLDLVTDRQDFLDIIDIYEKNKQNNPDTPLFIFNVTIGGHGSYFDSTYDEMPITITNFDADVELTNYVNHLWNTDQAIKMLTDYFSNINEDVIICMYGDHHPHFQDDAKEQLKEHYKNGENPSIDAMYSVPYFIWANFDIESYDDMGDESRDNVTYNRLSTMYLLPKIFETAGFQLSPYYRYLLDLCGQYPVITIPRSYDAEGNKVQENSTEFPDYYAKSRIQYHIEYNVLMDKDNISWDYFR